MNAEEERRILAALRDALAELYPTEARARRVAFDAGLNLDQIAFNESAKTFWHAILQEAKKSNKIDNLFSIAKTEYGPNIELRQVELFWLASQVELDQKDLQVLYADSLPPMQVKKEMAVSLEGALRKLWDCPLQWSIRRLPIFDFVERLAKYTHHSKLAKQLRTWIDESLDILKVGIQQDDVQRMREAIQKESLYNEARFVYLLVALLPDKLNPNRKLRDHRFSMRVVFWEDEETSQTWFGLDFKVYQSLEQVQDELDKLLSQRSDVLAKHTGNVVIEFFLPVELMSEGVDQWQDRRSRSQLRSITLGTRYKLVVRSLERAQERTLWEAWHRRWHRYQQLTTPKVEEHTWWIDSDRFDPNELWSQLELNQDIVCLVVPFRLIHSVIKCDLYDICLDAGIPFDMWTRKKFGVVPLDKLKGMIDSIHLLHLRQHLYQLRLEAVADKTHPGNDLALLWDDPHRIPPIFTQPLMVPLQKGETDVRLAHL